MLQAAVRALKSRELVADTTALVVFFPLTGIVNERFFAGMDWADVAASRVIGAPLMVLTARPYGIWRDWVLHRADATRGLDRLLWDTVALLTFQLPIYVAIIFAGGARGMDIVWAALGATAIMLLLGRPYGLWLDLVRRWFGLGPGGQKPMSLGD